MGGVQNNGNGIWFKVVVALLGLIQTIFLLWATSIAAKLDAHSKEIASGAKETAIINTKLDNLQTSVDGLRNWLKETSRERGRRSASNADDR